MLNREKYAKEIIEIACNGGGTLPSLMESWKIAEKHSATSVILMAAQ